MNVLLFIQLSGLRYLDKSIYDFNYQFQRRGHTLTDISASN